MNRTIIEKVRCMLFESGLHKKIWAEAVFAAVDIINALPNKSNNIKYISTEDMIADILTKPLPKH